MAAITDRAVVRLGDDEIKIDQSYTVEIGVMTQPCRFTLTMGHNGTVKELLKRYPPGTKFQLLVQPSGVGEPRLQFTGFTTARGAGGAASTVTFRGHDVLGKLINSTAERDKSYQGLTYLQFVTAVLADNGYTNITIQDSTLPDLKSKSGNAAGEIVQATVSSHVSIIAKRSHKPIVHPVAIRAGQPVYHFLRTYLDRAGLFLYATADGNVVLMQPDPGMPAIYTAVNKSSLRTAGAPGNVEDFEWDDDTTRRPSEVRVFGSGAGMVFGRSQATNVVTDAEMQGFGIEQPHAYIDYACASPDEAAFLGARKLAEARREGWSLRYLFAGHSTPSWNKNGRLIWTRDTMVDVHDDNLDLSGPHYIEHVTLSGSTDKTWTWCRLMRKDDLLFGTPEE